MSDSTSQALQSEQSDLSSFNFAKFISKGFWLALEHKWILIFAAFAITLLQHLLLVSSAILASSVQGSLFLMGMSGLFAVVGLLFLPVICVGLLNLIQQLESDSFKSSQLFKTMFIGFYEPFYKLLALGFYIVITHILFAIIMGLVAQLTLYMASQSAIDITSDEFVNYQNGSLFLAFAVIYPFLISPFVFSPFSLAFKTEMSVFLAMRNSFQFIFSNYFRYCLFLAFVVLIFVFFLVCISLIPLMLSGMISMLPWNNQFAVLQTMMIFPLIIVCVGACFCIAWFYCAIAQAYKEL